MAKVYIVDDSEIQLLILEKTLDRQGYDVHAFTNGVDVIKALEQDVPALIISDIEMPRMDGFELITTMRTQLAYREVPFFFVSSHTDEQTIRKAMKAGADLFFEKPVPRDVMLEDIERYLAA